MAPHSVHLFSTTPPIMSSSTNLTHDSITFDAAAFGPFKGIFAGAPSKTISVSMREAPYRTPLFIVTLKRWFRTLRRFDVHDSIPFWQWDCICRSLHPVLQILLNYGFWKSTPPLTHIATTSIFLTTHNQ